MNGYSLKWCLRNAIAKVEVKQEAEIYVSIEGNSDVDAFVNGESQLIK